MLTLDQFKAISPRMARNPITASKILPFLNEAMDNSEINSNVRICAFLAQLMHESGEFKYMEEIADGSAYEGRKDLGNTQPGDGKRYKGRGPIQLTGRNNYKVCGKALGLDLENNPELVATLEVGFKVACWFWNSKKLNSFADLNTQEGFDKITKKINGGYNGKADRDAKWLKAKQVLGC